MTTICLNMIVKNESANIERCISSLVNVIDDWVICDTGSTDNTIQIIEEFFSKHNKPGKIVKTAFKTFDQARNDALCAARENSASDFLLLVDADMEFQGVLDKTQLNKDYYLIKQTSSSLSYQNTRLVRRASPSTRYVGVTHEYLSVPGSRGEIDTCYFIDHATGSNRGNKAERDIQLLTEGLKNEPNNARYMFYLANTYKDIGHHLKAIHWYEQRIKAGGWEEEIWYAHYAISLCYLALSNDEKFITKALETYNIRPNRSEPIYNLAKYYREKGMNYAAVAMCKIGSAISYPTDSLFIEDFVYKHGFDEELSIAGYYVKGEDRQRAYEACCELTTNCNDVVRNQARNNIFHYLQSADEMFGVVIKPIDVVCKPNYYHPMNPSIYKDGSQNVGIVRTVNYSIKSDGSYHIPDGNIIKTENLFVEFDNDWNVIKQRAVVDKTGQNLTNYPVAGFEDCRLFKVNDSWKCSATVRNREGNPNGVCEIAILDLDLHSSDSEVFVTAVYPIRDVDKNQHQKNWMPVVNEDRATFIYNPWTALAVVNGKTEIIADHYYDDTNLTEFRGGAQVLPFKDGYIGLIHEVIYNNGKRVYLHRFVFMKKDFKILETTKPFYFKQKGVEFAAGMALDEDKLVVSFGVNDASAHLAFFYWSTITK